MISGLFRKKHDTRSHLEPGKEIRPDRPAKLLLQGEAKETLENSHVRLVVAGGLFLIAFTAISVRLLDVAVIKSTTEPSRVHTARTDELRFGRADIVDRNGILLATNLPTVNLYADARKVINPEETARNLVQTLPGLSYPEVFKRLSSKKAFVYLERGITPKQQYDINALGHPGLHFEKGESRVYPQGRALAHVVGMTNTDNQGLSGLELSFDQRLSEEGEPLALSIDVRIQHLLTAELSKAKEKFSALGAAGVVLDARTGELLALSSLPDFDPNSPPAVTDDAMFNRVTKGAYEMGSVFKLFNAAAALENGSSTMESSYDASQPLKVANFSIKDFHAKNRTLTVPEILIYSSNIGAAKMAIDLGTDAQRTFLGKLGMLNRASIELPETGAPLLPSPWRPINTMTIAYGHGISVTPLHVASAVATLVNGGFHRPATLLRHSEGRFIEGERVLSFDTSRKMRHLMRLVVEQGSGRNAEVKGYQVGGKTGSAEKINASGRYEAKTIISSFVAAFPMSEPRYVVMTVLDEPKGIKETYGYATAGWTSAPVAGRVVEQLGLMMGLPPRFTGMPSGKTDGKTNGLVSAVARGGSRASQ